LGGGVGGVGWWWELRKNTTSSKVSSDILRGKTKVEGGGRGQAKEEKRITTEEGNRNRRSVLRQAGVGKGEK